MADNQNDRTHDGNDDDGIVSRIKSVISRD